MACADLSLIVPAFNEERRIQRSIEDLLVVLPGIASRFEILVIDDGSQDDTAAIVDRISARNRAVQLHRMEHRGKGAAVRAGMIRSSGALRFMCDADLSMHPSQIERFMALVPHVCDIAVASREAVGARRIDEPAYRHVMGRIFNQLVRATLLRKIQDTQCGFKMFSCRAAELIFRRARIDGWSFDVEALYIARIHGLQVREVPIVWTHEKLSRVSAVRDTIRMVGELRKIRQNAKAGVYA